MPESIADAQLLAGLIAACCAHGMKHEGKALGRIENIAAVQTYISEPPNRDITSSKRIILYFSDVYGPFYINSQLLMDYFASRGYIVLGLDYFFGDYLYHHIAEEGFDLFKWGYQKDDEAKEITRRWIDEVRNIYGEDSLYCATGYCFGGPYAIDVAGTDKVVAAAFAHPAKIHEIQFRSLKQPLLMCCAESDFTFPTESRQKAESILEEIKATYQVQVYSGVTHGFATRGDISVENIRWAKEHAAESVVSWFDRFTSKNTV